MKDIHMNISTVHLLITKLNTRSGIIFIYTLSTFITDVRNVWATVVKSIAELVTVALTSNRASTDTTAISAAVSVTSVHT